jgi:two-component SAPR family response regulator
MQGNPVESRVLTRTNFFAWNTGQWRTSKLHRVFFILSPNCGTGFMIIMREYVWCLFRNAETMVLSLRRYWFILLLMVSGPFQAAAHGGLKFHGSEQPINQRTSYNVFGERSVSFTEYFDIEFNISLYPTTEFGYLLRVKNKEGSRIYNLFYDGQGDHLTFRLNEEGTSNLIVANMNKGDLLDRHWFRMKIRFDLIRDSIHLTIHDRTFSTGNNELPDTYYPIILFGKSDYIIDVPSFAIRDLVVGNGLKYHFALKERQGTIVHDAEGNAFGHVSNPEWLMNDAYHWRYKVSFNSRSVAGANYSPENKEVYYFNRDSLRIYNVRSGTSSIRVFDEPCPVQPVLGTNFIDSRNNKLYAYEVFSESYSGPTVASLDLSTYQWTAETTQQLPGQLHHHGGFLDTSAGQYTIFGGFGNMRYSKTFYSFDLDKKEWTTLEGFSGDSISPRYFSSVGYLEENNSIYIFGGMGNESGEQIVGRKYYYDLHKVDLTTKKITKLWDIQWNRDNVVPVRGMVILDDSSFYTLCYPEHFSESFLRLYRFSLKDGSHEILGDSIPIQSDKITTNANLYLESGLNNLYAVVQEFDDDISSTLKVYSLAFPPVTAAELAGYPARKGGNAWIAIVIICVAATGVGYLVYRKFKTTRDRGENTTQQMPAISDKPETSERSNAIFLFGDFTVRDRNNRDITYMFSAQLRQIFCLVLQYSTTEDGITSQRLSGILWPDKPADKVKNSRGVTINHLRKVLNELDGIELVYEKGFFKLLQHTTFYCDYTRCMEIVAEGVTEYNREELMLILTRGKFLQLADHPLFDSFKDEMEKKLEPVLTLEVEKTFSQELYSSTIAIAEALLNLDPLNEVAFTFLIKAMQKLRMNDDARLRYQAFVTEYRKIMDAEYPNPYKNLV